MTVDVREPMHSFRDGKSFVYDGGSNMNWDHHDAIYSTSNTNIPNGGPAPARRYRKPCLRRARRIRRSRR